MLNNEKGKVMKRKVFEKPLFAKKSVFPTSDDDEEEKKKSNKQTMTGITKTKAEREAD